MSRMSASQEGWQYGLEMQPTPPELILVSDGLKLADMITVYAR